jgi:hypothetical protein
MIFLFYLGAARWLKQQVSPDFLGIGLAAAPIPLLPSLRVGRCTASQKYSKCPVSLLIKDFSKISLKAIFGCKEAFRVKKKITKELKRRKQRIQYRLRDINLKWYYFL